MSNSSEYWRLWYDRPAEQWTEALPVGNGKIGGMIYGGIHEERIGLNEESVWSGKPHYDASPGMLQTINQVRNLLFDGNYRGAHELAEQSMKTPLNPHYGSYQSLGDLYIKLDLPTGEVTDYRRELDLNQAICKTTYTIGGTQYSREVICTNPDQVMVIRLEASDSTSLSGCIRMEREFDTIVYQNGQRGLTLRGACDYAGVYFDVSVEVHAEEGQCSSAMDSVIFRECKAITVYVSANTTYRHKDPHAENQSILQLAGLKSWEALREAHIYDHQSLFNRLDINLGIDLYKELPTDVRLAQIKSGQHDPYLAALYVQFGRYLLIASSRKGTLPANLQGIWNDSFTPPWFSDFTININAQMNYWHAETCNLSELHEPLFDLMDSLVEPGRKTAKERYGCNGMVLSTRTNPWLNTSLRATSSLLWQEGAAWLSRHYWDHYLFTGDIKLLEQRAYPFMKEAARFYLDFMVEHPRYKWLVTGPTTSPENTFTAADGTMTALDMSPTMAVQIIDDLFENCIRASEELGQDQAFRELLIQKRSQLPPMKAGKFGQLQEWLEDHEETEPGHRHISHLFGVYPGHSISRKTPDLWSAARIALERRLQHGGGHTGWSCAWIINLWAHLGDGEQAHQYMNTLFTHSTHDNLFDNHPPFQIDGNFGGAAGIVEMLIQSNEDEIRLLPALPGIWATGNIRGVCARNGFELEFYWQDSVVNRAIVYSKLGRRCRLQCNSNVTEAEVLCSNERIPITIDHGSLEFDTQPGKQYQIIFTSDNSLI
ncbi:glycosyl hydrolase family 95 catalytic domain-containing protein [Paenibacillus radicis (ex Xue et al. 2023)]|uniref:Glycoside hydrolase N-terminal domain-containing protein n=1 Tax=Paenibacillus radicis (ex Xue et al. 2023) TaxID=2972489 RepID=A0ABT1YHT7_9BACL|nr:glycoside hydrolase N-terminal domain-containing protein [Paenibacillus radicis (ex Xue et al. 2023)]MCR8632746.1 glycoside hydrolase N-terminal domain-containing protein [Paenibacillus radicis (ex Xue et al. 2023)]